MIPAIRSSSRKVTPLLFPGLGFWWTSKDLGAIDLVSGAVSNWYDKSGNGRTISQATAGSRPAWSASGIASGYPGVTFDGTDDCLTRAEAWMYAAGSCTVYMVVVAAAMGANRVQFGEGSTSSNTPQYSHFNTTGTAADVKSKIVNDAAANVLASTPNTSGVFSSAVTLIGRIDSGTQMTGRTNGTTGGGPIAYTRSATTLNTFALGAKAQAAPSVFSAMTVGEIVGIERRGAIPTNERDMIEGYFAREWPITLIAGHPWYGVSP